MTLLDRDIIKAFECCTKIEEGESLKLCFECPMFEEDVDNCTASLFRAVLDLINRQQTEIEEQDQAIINALHRMGEVRAEAIKEFAERLLESKYESSDWSHGEHPYVVEESDIENLLYELTEVSNGK